MKNSEADYFCSNKVNYHSFCWITRRQTCSINLHFRPLYHRKNDQFHHQIHTLCISIALSSKHLRKIYMNAQLLNLNKHFMLSVWKMVGQQQVTPPLISPHDTRFHFTQALVLEKSGLLDINALTEGWRKVKYPWICWYERWGPLHNWWRSFSLTEQTDNSNRLLTGISESLSGCMPWDDVHSHSIHQCITLLRALSALGDAVGTCCWSIFLFFCELFSSFKSGLIFKETKPCSTEG